MKKKLLSILLTASVLSSYSSFGAFAKITNAKPSVNQFNLTTKSPRTSFRSTNSIEDKKKDVFLHGNLSEKLVINEQTILAYLEKNKSMFTTANGADFKVLSIKKSADSNYTIVKIAQTSDGIPIHGSQIILHLDKDGIVKNIVGTVNKNYNTPRFAVKRQNISSIQAINIAKKQFSYSSLVEEPKAEKEVIIKNGAATEVYSVNIHYIKPDIANWNVLIDASSGNVIKILDKIEYSGPTNGTGTAVDGTTKPLNLYFTGKLYEMLDTTKPMNGQIKTYSADNEETEPGNMVTNNTNKFTMEKYKSAVSAHYYAGVVYDFYKNTLGRNSIDDNGMNIISTTHYGNSYNNAYWDGSQMVYGDGDGTTYTYFSGDLDVVGHELTHGVTQYTANLDYQDQSGALNESISDVFGVLIETYDKYNVKRGGSWRFNSTDWAVGRGIYLNNTTGKALRSLADPTLYDQPDNMYNYVDTSDDNGGVHSNSGIPNKAAYLVAKSIGCPETAKIYYKALTSYLTSSSDFSSARNALVSAASELYGDSSTEVTAVNDAFDTVGVSSSNN